MEKSKGSYFKHYCRCCGKELSPILWDLYIISLDGKSYDICNNCYKFGIKNGSITDKKLS